MKNLYIFGDSFSYPYKINLEESWPILLADKLGYELKLFSNPGASNFQIYLSVMDELNNIDKDDIVIISTTWFERYYLPLFKYGVTINDVEKKIEHNLELDNMEQFYLDNFNYQKSVSFNQKLFNNLFNLLDRLELNYFYWNLAYFNIENKNKIIYPEYSNINKISFFYNWIDVDNNMWLDDSDRHFGQMGSKTFCEFLYKKII
jgi:hypothetical protein